jgi:hypothetical protein
MRPAVRGARLTTRLPRATSLEQLLTVGELECKQIDYHKWQGLLDLQAALGAKE